MGIDRSGWRHLGQTSNADFYEVGPELLAVVPFDNSRDDEKSARESIAFQDAHWRAAGRRGAAVIFMDPVLEQDGGARAVYANETHHTLSTCYALVGETIYAYATSTVFTGLARPGVPTQVFRSFADARPFIEQMNRERGGAL